MTKSVSKKQPSNNLLVKKTQKKKKEKQRKQLSPTSKQSVNQQKISYQKIPNIPTNGISKLDLHKNIKKTKLTIVKKTSNNKPQQVSKFKGDTKRMLQRKIYENTQELKEKPYLNYFHNLNYTQDLRKCDNCFEGFTSDENEMLYCEECNSYIHRACYSLSLDQYDSINQQETEDECNFTFIKCESCFEREINPENDIDCMICGRNVGIMKCFLFDHRKVVYASNKNKQLSEYEYYIDKMPVVMLTDEQIKKNTNIQRVFAHPLCVNSCSCLFIYQLKFLLIWDEEDYKKKINFGKKQKCSQCNKGSGLLIQCEHTNKIYSSCKEYYHPFCAAEKKMIYYQQGMRLIHQNSNVKYSEQDEAITYYYIICPNHVSKIFQQKYTTGFFNDKKMSTQNEQKNYDDWISQMMSEYGVRNKTIQNEQSNSKKKSSESNSSQLSLNSLNEKQLMDFINLDNFAYTKKKDAVNKRTSSYEGNISIMQNEKPNQKKQKSNESTDSIKSKQNNEDTNIISYQPKEIKDVSLISKKTNSNDIKISSLNIKTSENGQTKTQSSAILADIFEDVLKQKDISNEKLQQVVENSNIKNNNNNNNKNEMNDKQLITTKVIQRSKLEIKKESYINNKGIIVEKIFSDQNKSIKREFEDKIKQERTTSVDIFGGPITKLINQENEKTKSIKSMSNVLKRELGIELPSPQKKKKKKCMNNGKDFQEKEEIQEGEQMNHSSSKKKNNQKKIENKDEANEFTPDDTKDNDENYDEESRNSSEEEDEEEEESCDSQNNKILRRSGRIKKTPQSLDNKIFRLYEQKKSSLKMKEESSESKQSSSDAKQLDSSVSINKRNEKSKKTKVEQSKDRKCLQSQKQKQLIYLDSYSEEESKDKDSESQELFSCRKKRSAKKVKEQDKPTEENYKRYLSFNDVVITSEDEDENNKKSTSLKQKKRDYRNLDKRDDESNQDDLINQEDSFQILLNSEPKEQEEIQEIGYVLEKLNGYEIDKKEDFYQNQEEHQLEDEDDDNDAPIDLPDLNLDDDNEDDNHGDESKANENKIISRLEGSIDLVEQKIKFLREDSKLKKHSILNEKNYEEYQIQELNRLVNRKNMLEKQIVEKRKVKIEKYKQSLHYFNQTIDQKCVPDTTNITNRNRKILENNVDYQVPQNRLMKFKQPPPIEKNNEIDLCFLPYINNTQFDILGFSSSIKVTKQVIDNNKIIHNFFCFQG